MMFDDDMPPALHDYILSLPKSRVFEIMWEALQLMQQYNGRTERYCIFRAAGFTEHEKDGRTVWKAPPPEPKDEVVTPLKVESSVFEKIYAIVITARNDLKAGRVIHSHEHLQHVLKYIEEQQKLGA